MDEINEKNSFICNFFKLDAQGRKAFYLRRKRQNGNPNHVPLRKNFPRKKRTKLHWGTIYFEEQLI
jgi:hypothetical protein